MSDQGSGDGNDTGAAVPLLADHQQQQQHQTVGQPAAVLPPPPPGHAPPPGTVMVMSQGPDGQLTPVGYMAQSQVPQHLLPQQQQQQQNAQQPYIELAQQPEQLLPSYEQGYGHVAMPGSLGPNPFGLDPALNMNTLMMLNPEGYRKLVFLLRNNMTIRLLAGIQAMFGFINLLSTQGLPFAAAAVYAPVGFYGVARWKRYAVGVYGVAQFLEGVWRILLASLIGGKHYPMGIAVFSCLVAFCLGVYLILYASRMPKDTIQAFAARLMATALLADEESAPLGSGDTSAMPSVAAPGGGFFLGGTGGFTGPAGTHVGGGGTLVDEGGNDSDNPLNNMGYEPIM